MKADTIFWKAARRIVYIVSALGLGLLTLSLTLNAMASTGKLTGRTESTDSVSRLPSIFGTEGPAGNYYCYEYEFGMIWSADVITLNSDGTSEYEYCHPYMNSPTGTWSYNYSIRQVGFTGFRWVTATFTAPDRLWARRYLSQVGFEIAIQCYRTEELRSCSSGP